MTQLSPERIKQIEDAYTTMKRRGWGFSSNGRGFGDPAATFTAIGPFVNGIVEVVYVDKDCVEAVRRAVEIYDSRK